MNEEEKEAIECLELVIDNESDIETEDLTNKCINNILNLIKKQQKEIEELRNRKAENYYHWKHLEAKIINKKIKYKKERANMTQIIFSKYGKTQRTFNQAVVNEVIKVLDEILGE